MTRTTHTPMLNDIAAVQQQGRRFSFNDGEIDEAAMHEFFNRAREQCPVVKTEAILGGSYLVSKFDDVSRCLKDWRTFGHEVEGYPGAPIDIPIQVDPPLHTELRKDLNPQFSLRSIRRYQDKFRVRANQYLEPILGRGSGDLVSEFSTPFPVYSFMSMFGAPPEDTDQMVVWKDALFAGFKGDSDAQQEVVFEILPAVERYFNRLLDERLDLSPDARPDDLLTAVVTADVGSRPYTRDEMVRLCRFLMVAGLDTVTHMLARILLHLAENAEHHAMLVREPGLIPNAVEELLRHNGIVSTFRHASVDTEIRDQVIRAGERVELVLPSAGRDEGVYDDAHTVDFRRKDIKHFAFGGGPHRCLGLHLARIELQVAVEAFVSLVPHFRLDPDYPRPKVSIGYINNVDHLRVVIDK